jgi:hypothetical protein
MNLLLEGLLNHPFVGIEPSDRSALELRGLIAKLEEAEVRACNIVRFPWLAVCSRMMQ